MREESSLNHLSLNKLRGGNRFFQRKILFLIILVALVVISMISTWWFFYQNRPIIDPFDAKTLAAAGYPLYYPKQLPKGYKIEKKSLNMPAPGVIVFNLISSKDQKIYISEEARPSKFDFGGYYNHFQDRQLKVMSLGTIAVGRIDNGQTEIGSLATSKTWILTNTQSKVPLDQLMSMLNSLVMSY